MIRNSIVKAVLFYSKALIYKAFSFLGGRVKCLYQNHTASVCLFFEDLNTQNLHFTIILTLNKR